MEVSINTRLYEVFVPNFLEDAQIKVLKLGDIFELTDSVALVIEGVVGVDGYDYKKGMTITLRLAELGDVLNIERIFDQPLKGGTYVCETAVAVVAIVPVNYFKNKLNSDSHEVANAVMQELLSKMYKINTDSYETVIGLGVGTSHDKLLWALKRYQRVTKSNAEVKIRKMRLATHVGFTAETISRGLAQLVDNGELVGKTHSCITLKEAT